MNCCNQDNNNNNNSNNNKSTNGGHSRRGHMGHMWMMLLCCGAPVVMLAVVSLLGTVNLGLRTTLGSIIPFLCPVMMIAMIPMMLKKNRDGSEQGGAQRQEALEEHSQDNSEQ